MKKLVVISILLLSSLTWLGPQPNPPEKIDVVAISFDKASQEFVVEMSAPFGIAQAGERALFTVSTGLEVAAGGGTVVASIEPQTDPVARDGMGEAGDTESPLVPQRISWDRNGGAFDGEAQVTATTVLRSPSGQPLGAAVVRVASVLILGASSIFVDEGTGGLLILPEIPELSISVAPGAATFPDGSKDGIITLNSLEIVRPMGPTTMFTLNISPSGVLFDPPAPITLPNLDGLAPGEAVTLFSFDHDIGQFVVVGPGTVAEDGLVIVSDPGFGITRSG